MSSSGTARRRSTSRGRPSSAKKGERSGTPKRASSRSTTRVSSLATQNDVPTGETRRRGRAEASSASDDSPVKATRRSTKAKQHSAGSGFSFKFNSETATSVSACAFLLFFSQVVVYSVFSDEVKDDVIHVLGCLLSKAVANDIIATIGKFYLHILLPLPIYYFSTLILIGDPKKADDSAKALSRLVQIAVSLSYFLYALTTDGGDADWFEDEVSRAFIYLSLVASINEILLYHHTYNTAKLIHFGSVVLVNLFFVFFNFKVSQIGLDFFEQFLLAHALCLATSNVSGLVKNGLIYFDGSKPTFLVHVVPYVFGLFSIAILLFGEFSQPTPLLAYVYAVVYIGFHAKDTNSYKEEAQ